MGQFCVFSSILHLVTAFYARHSTSKCCYTYQRLFLEFHYSQRKLTASAGYFPSIKNTDARKHLTRPHQRARKNVTQDESNKFSNGLIFKQFFFFIFPVWLVVPIFKLIFDVQYHFHVNVWCHWVDGRSNRGISTSKSFSIKCIKSILPTRKKCKFAFMRISKWI